MKKAYEDDSDLSEIVILPDGRLYVFGMSESVAEVMEMIERESETIRQEPVAVVDEQTGDVCG